MKKYVWLFIFLVIIVVLFIFAGIKASRKADKKTGNSKGRISGKAIPVEVISFGRHNLKNIITFTGTLEPWSRYEVAPKIAGRLERINVDIGDAVRNGELLAAIDHEEYKQEVEKAKADLAISIAVRDECVTNFNLSKSEYERAYTLKSRDVISKSEYDAKLSEYLVKKATLRKAEAELNQKKAVLNAAEIRLGYTDIYARWQGKDVISFELVTADNRLSELKKIIATASQSEKTKFDIASFDIKELAPNKFRIDVKLPENVYNFVPFKLNVWRFLKAIGGRGTKVSIIEDNEDVRFIGKKFVDSGQMLKANEAILTIVDIKRMKAVVNVIEKDYPLIVEGSYAAVTTDAYPGRIFAGKVRKVSKVLDEYTRQAEVEIEVNNKELLLRPGMFIKVSIELGTISNALTVPLNALVDFNDQKGIFMLAGKNGDAARFVPVKTGIKQEGNIQIVSPSELQGKVITLGNHLLYNGALVKITNLQKQLNSSDKSGKQKAQGRKQKNTKGR
jgi:multidrug efflux pump subunit AcrA (membrane-fusion protein)